MAQTESREIADTSSKRVEQKKERHSFKPRYYTRMQGSNAAVNAGSVSRTGWHGVWR